MTYSHRRHVEFPFTCFVSSCCFSFTATSKTFSSVCLLLISGWLLVNSLTTLLMPSGPARFNILGERGGGGGEGGEEGVMLELLGGEEQEEGREVRIR